MERNVKLISFYYSQDWDTVTHTDALEENKNLFYIGVLVTLQKFVTAISN